MSIGFSSNRRGDGGQSEIIGLVLILGITMVAIGMILFFGGDALAGIDTEVQKESMKNQFALMDANMANSVLGGSEVQRTNLRMRGGVVTSQPEAAWMNISYEPSQESIDEHDAEFFHINTSIGNIEYSFDDTLMAYEGGGVWMKDEFADTSTMISPPEFHYSSLTLTVPKFNVTGDMQTAGDTRNLLVEADETRRMETRVDGFDENPVFPGQINITVHSQYYQAWADYFDKRTEGDVVDLDHDDKTVKLMLPVPEPGNIDSSISAEGNNLELIEEGFSDSYDSDAQAWSEGGTSYGNCAYEPLGFEGDIATGGQLNLEDNSCVFGDVVGTSSTGSANNIRDNVVVGGDVHSDNQIDITDDAQVLGDKIVASNHINIEDEADIEVNEIHSDGGDVDCDEDVTGSVDYINATGNVDQTCIDELGNPIVGDEVDSPELDTHEFEIGNLPGAPNDAEDFEDDTDDGCEAEGNNELRVSDDCEIESGSYEIDSMVIEDGATLQVNGDVNISMPGGGGDELDVSGTISIKGSLEFHVSGQMTVEMSGIVESDDEANEYDNEHVAEAFFLNAYGNTHIDIEDEAEITGVIYAPETQQAVVHENSQVFGAFITDGGGEVRGAVHYDVQLQHVQTTAELSEVYFLHVTETPIEVR